jgi:hypothetical protein
MKIKIISLVVLVIIYCISVLAEDSIDALVTDLNSDKFGLWVNGIFPSLDLPPEASSKQVIDKAVLMAGFDEERITSYQIVEIRRVDLKAVPDCSAALLKTNIGEKILLFKYEGTLWWSRFFDIPNNKPNQRLEPIASLQAHPERSAE